MEETNALRGYLEEKYLMGSEYTPRPRKWNQSELHSMDWTLENWKLSEWRGFAENWVLCVHSIDPTAVTDNSILILDTTTRIKLVRLKLENFKI